MEQRRSLLAWVLIPILVLSALVACADKKDAPPAGGEKAVPHDGQWGAGVYVDPAWSFARDVTGHRIHVKEQKVECVKCHASTANKMGPVTPDRCAACHEKEGHIEHASAEAAKRFGTGTKAVCTACHAFTLEGKRRAEALLKDPPRIPIDGGVGGAPSYAVESYEPSDCKRCHASQQGQRAPVTEHTPHGSQPCLSCHQPHAGPPKSAPCSDCHKEITTRHAAAGKSLIETCSTCHEHRHSPAKDAVATCAACHAKQEPVIPATALFAGGHTQCIGCHKPHAFEKKEATPCRSCHAQVNVIGAGSIAAHNGCANCHAPHNVRASAPAACPTCHKNVHSDHPGQAGNCVGCHDPHPKPTRASEGIDVNACSSCHKFAGSDQGAHRGAACTGCHKPHSFKLALSSVATCSGCHEARVHQTSLNKGHQACEGCHRGLPHHPEPDKVGCDTCHRKEAGLVKAGHARCIGCHEPHSGAQATPCANCHRAEQQTAPKGHQACLNCHEPHAGLPAKKVCADCHRTEQASAHGRINTGCQTCHRPHGPNGVASVPACSTCHQREQLPGLHAEAKHQPCSLCHSGHEEPSAPKRSICLGCHKDRADHFPHSPRCASCHLFTKTP